MRLIKFPYSFHKGMRVPIIPVKLKGNKDWFEFWAYVDSGATYSIFMANEAELLGIKTEEGKRGMVVVGDGSFIPVYFHKIPLKIEETEILATIGFSEKLGVGFNLLGRLDIFNYFKVCFDDSLGIVTFQKK